jgi:hypothetical protein
MLVFVLMLAAAVAGRRILAGEDSVPLALFVSRSERPG